MTDQINMRGPVDVRPRSVAFALLSAALVVLGLYVALCAGPAMRAAAHAQLVRAIAQEDQKVCEKLGMRPGTDASAACSRELSTVRQTQVDRDRAAAGGVL